MKKSFLSSVLTVLLLLGLSPAYAGPIAIKVADISDLSNYINDPLFSPFFGVGSTTIIDFEGPWSPPNVGSFFNLGLVGSTYNSLGIKLWP